MFYSESEAKRKEKDEKEIKKKKRKKKIFRHLYSLLKKNWQESVYGEKFKECQLRLFLIGNSYFFLTEESGKNGLTWVKFYFWWLSRWFKAYVLIETYQNFWHKVPCKSDSARICECDKFVDLDTIFMFFVKYSSSLRS